MKCDTISTLVSLLGKARYREPAGVALALFAKHGGRSLFFLSFLSETYLQIILDRRLYKEKEFQRSSNWLEAGNATPLLSPLQN